MEQFTIRPFLQGNAEHHFHKHDFIFTNQSLWMCIVVGAASLFLVLAVARPQLVPGRMQSMAELAYEFVANMIRSAAGEDGMIFFPFVFTIFVFVLFSNFFGLLPGSFTVTSQIAVTFALACLVMADRDRHGIRQARHRISEALHPEGALVSHPLLWLRSNLFRSSRGPSASPSDFSPTCWAATRC